MKINISFPSIIVIRLLSMSFWLSS